MCVFLCVWDWKWKERCEFFSVIVKCKKGFFAIILSLTFSLSSLFSHTHTNLCLKWPIVRTLNGWPARIRTHTNPNAYTKEIDKYCSKYYFLSFVWRSGIFRQHLSHGENDEKGCIIIIRLLWYVWPFFGCLCVIRIFEIWWP